MDICICMAESLQSSPETITTLLIGCSSIQIILLLKKLIKIKLFFRKEKFVWCDRILLLFSSSLYMRLWIAIKLSSQFFLIHCVLFIEGQ